MRTVLALSVCVCQFLSSAPGVFAADDELPRLPVVCMTPGTRATRLPGEIIRWFYFEATNRALVFTQTPIKMRDTGSSIYSCLVDLSANRILHQWCEPNAIGTLGVSADGETYAIGTAENTVKVVKTESGELVCELHGASEPIQVVALSHDGKQVAALTNSSVHCWELATGKLNWIKHSGTWTDADIFYSRGRDELLVLVKSAIVVLKASTGETAYSIPTDETNYTSRGLSPNGDYLAGADGNTVRIWNLRERKLCNKIERAHMVSALQVDDSGRARIAVLDGSIVVSSPGEEPVVTRKGGPIIPGLAQFNVDAHGCFTLAFRGDDGEVVAAQCGRAIGIRTISNVGLVNGKRIEHETTSIAVSPDGQSFATNETDGAVRVWNSRTGEIVSQVDRPAVDVPAIALISLGVDTRDRSTPQEFPCIFPFEYVQFSSTGEELVTIGDDVCRWNAVDGHRIATLDRIRFPEEFTSHDSSTSPDRELIVRTGNKSGGTHWIDFEGNRIEVWKLDTQELLGKLDVAEKGILVREAYITANKKVVHFGREDAIARWDIESGRVQVSEPFEDSTQPFGSHVAKLAVSRNERFLAAIHLEGQLTIVDAMSLETKCRLGSTEQRFRCCVWGADSNWLLAGDEAGRIVLIDPEKGTVVRTYQGHDEEVTCMALSDDGRRLFTAGREGRKIVWDVSGVALPTD